MQTCDKFLSCDWGTSSFRLRLVDASNIQVLLEENSSEGIAATYALWEKTGKTDQQSRLYFYLDIIRKHIEKIGEKQNTSLSGVPLIISGMASSSIGMKNLPYGQLPFGIDGSGTKSAYFEADEGFKHPFLLISGVKSVDDVMRGEETQLIGSMAGQPDAQGEKTFIFPGTHSKHIFVRENQVTGFKTYMTGEYFELLSEKSILKVGVEAHDDFHSFNGLQSFKQGVQDAVGANLLHISFRVRTNDLFEHLSKKENFSYLSGLLIGTELQGLLPLSSAKIYLCCSSNLKPWYEAALDALGILENVHVFPAEWVSEAVVRGQYEIFNQFISKR